MTLAGEHWRTSWLTVAVMLHAVAATADTNPLRPTCSDFTTEAARTAGLPEPWIAAVMRAESGGDPGAISSAGARGCMQVMPSTWRDLQSRGVAGPDPFDARSNMIAGAIYLRTMHDRYGWPDALAAYHAGAGRFEDYLANGRRLPTATLAYVTRISSWLDQVGPATVVSPSVGRSRSWTQAPIFITSSTVRPIADGRQIGQATSAPVAGEAVRLTAEQTDTGSRDTIFVIRRP